MSYYIYKLTNTTNGKGYVGYTSDLKRRMRQHKDAAKNGKRQVIHAAIRKYGWESFVVEELYRSEDKQQTLDTEDHFINLHETKGIKGYNVTRGGQQGPPKGYVRKPMTEEKLMIFRDRMKDPTVRGRISDGLVGNTNKRGWIAPLETKQRQSKSLKGRQGRIQSKEEKQQRSKRMFGNQFALGTIHSEDRRRKHSEYMKNRDHSYKIGRPLSEEHKRKISESLKRTLQGG